MSIEETLGERQKTHGEFSGHAKIVQGLKKEMKNAPSWYALSDAQKEALEMIQFKVARILNGNPDHKDHWDDIAGYAALASRSAGKIVTTDAPGQVNFTK